MQKRIQLNMFIYILYMYIKTYVYIMNLCICILQKQSMIQSPHTDVPDVLASQEGKVGRSKQQKSQSDTLASMPTTEKVGLNTISRSHYSQNSNC